MPRPIEALVHTQALAGNLQRLRLAAGDARVWAVVKADAYGHGIERVYPALMGADGFALLDLAEAERVRALGWRGPVLLLEGVFEPRDLETCSRLRLWHTIHREEQIDWLAAHKTRDAHTVVLKLNSGMNRLGLQPRAFRQAWTRLDALAQVESIVLATHFSDADGPRGIAHQMEVFAEATRDLPGERSVANSAALLRHGRADGGAAEAAAGADRVRSDWVRPGIAVYGSSPDHPEHTIAHWGLLPAMSLRARILATQSLAPGDTVGYGSRFTAREPLRIGVVACGYADGYPRGAPCSGLPGEPVTPVLVNGRRSRLLGRVSMDMLTVDLSGFSADEAGVGSEVTLWGRAGDGSVLAIDEVAQAAGTIGYELMCALARRVTVRCVD